MPEVAAEEQARGAVMDIAASPCDPQRLSERRCFDVENRCMRNRIDCLVGRGATCRQPGERRPCALGDAGLLIVAVGVGLVGSRMIRKYRQ